ncbi:MAG: FAD-binding oxidoreductase, partial [Bdellovibrionota bacterium]
VSVGGGAALGEVYAVTGKRNLAIPGGTCPPVGVSGHALGGGFGELGRQFGLACDSIVSIELVDATGTVLNCSDSENQDLFWALRGGGGGSFGVATKYVFRTHSVPQLSVFGYNWVLAPKPAAAIFKAWQQWIVQAPEQITANCRITTDANGTPTVHIAGVTVGAASALQAEIKKITGVAPQKQYITPKSFLDMVRFYSGGPKGDWPINEKGNNAYVYDQTWTKGKSDFVYDVMSDEGMLALFAAQQKHPGITALFDGYGASIAKVAPDATAFAHRKAIACVQHVSTFDSESLKTIKAPALDARLASVRAYYDSLRPYFSGKAYLNYPDRDLKDYATAYWGDNLERLKKIKAAVDPDNFYCHAQSVPV